MGAVILMAKTFCRENLNGRHNAYFGRRLAATTKVR